MNKLNLITDSFEKGFSLANKCLSLFLFGLCLSILSEILDLFGDFPMKGILQVIVFLMVILQTGFYLSLPIFLVNRQQGKTVAFSNIMPIILKNAKRLILPAMLLCFSAFLVGALSFFMLAQFVFGGNFNFLQNNSLGFYVWNLVVALLIGLFSFLTFAPIYYLLERNSLLKSIKRSISFCINNFKFFLIVFVVSASTFLISTLVFNDFQNPYHLFIRNILGNYEYILLAAVSLIFYQSRTVK